MIVTREHFDAAIVEQRREGWLISNESLRLLQRMVAPVISDPSFYDCPGSRAGKHHFFRGGLATHTYEVLTLALASAERHHTLGDYLDFSVLTMAAIWHDVGKIQEYVMPNGLPDYGATFATEGEARAERETTNRGLYYVSKAQCTASHHITKAAYQIGHMCATMGFTDSVFIEKVLHTIEAHHGRREWGSPNVPGTLEAMILHHADMQSVMRNCGNNPSARP